MAAAPISNKDDDVTQSSFFIRLSASENERDAKNYSSRQRNGKLSDAITAFFIRDHYKVSTLFDSIRIKSILSMCPFSFFANICSRSTSKGTLEPVLQLSID